MLAPALLPVRLSALALVAQEMWLKALCGSQL